MAKKVAGRPKKRSYRTGNVFVLRGTSEYREWLNGLAAHLGTPATILVDQLLRKEAKRVGYRPAPQRLEAQDEDQSHP